MTDLFIIGNGFDLWHGLPTSFGQFVSFARKRLDEIEQFYSFTSSSEDLWTDFEKSLGRFNSREFFDVHNHVDVMDERSRPRDVFCLEDDLVEQADNYVEAIREEFAEWVREIDIHAAKKKLRFPPDAWFITFNYTSTLQAVYGVNDDRVLHLHGCVDKYDDLIFGHGEPTVEEPELDENGDSNRTPFSDSESAARYPFEALRKPVCEVIEKNRSAFESLQSVSRVIVVGHSLNDIDLPYFGELAAHTSTAQWLVCLYSTDERCRSVSQLERCGIPHANIQTCMYADLQHALRL